MNRIRHRGMLIIVGAVVLLSALAARGQTAPSAPVNTAAPTTAPATGAPVTGNDPTQAITQLRQELIDSFNKGDLDRLLSHLDPDVVVTWQNGEVCRGPEAVRAYYNKMMTGPEWRVQKVSADPKVDDRHVYGDWAVSWGSMNDHFVLTSGEELSMNSRFTATIARRGDAWKVTSFHASVNAFANPILRFAAKKAGSAGLLIGVIVGVLASFIATRIVKRRRAGGGTAPGTGGPTTT